MWIEIAKPTQLKPRLKPMELNVWMHLSILLISFITIAAECPESGSCETCDLTMSASLMSVNNVISVSQQAEITFTLNFQQQGHNGFSFKVNNTLFHQNIRNSDFPCISEMDTPSVTQTLEVQYHCTAITPGIYIIEAYVYYCDRDYNAQTLTVTVENDPPTSTSSTDRVLPSMTLNPSLIPPTPTSSILFSSTTITVIPLASSSRLPTSTSTYVLPSSTTDNDLINNHEGKNTVVVVICVFTGLILAVVLMIAVILLLIYHKRRPKAVLCCNWWSDQPIPDQPIPDQPGDHLMQEIQYGSNTAISETSNEASGSYVAVSDYPTPVESVSAPVVQLEEVVLSEPITQEPNDARTPHQLGKNQREVSTD